ncbi:MATE family efflux transporter [Cesiribacter sp. SM1]|uniref:MATE family efflux transporter n=1 Tax=Cesiribacter sp. SM1 TaxID=2861196 RepID=UPI001CD40650|nr:MATE family efflux transporter [Cesiribacter sp. SM1]
MREENAKGGGPTVLNRLLRLSGPIVLANILQTAYQLIDTFWLGRIGAGAVAAVSISFPILFLIISLGIGLTLAGSILAAQYKGRNDQRMIDYVSAQTLFVMLFISAGLAGIGYSFAQPLMEIIGAEDTILEDSVSYFKVSSLGFVFLFIYFVFQSLMRGIGNVAIPMYVVLTTVLLNLVLDPLFIYGWGPAPAMGVAGAAMASVFTQGLSAVAGIWIMASGRFGIKLHLKDFKFDFTWVRELIRIGVPASLEMSTRALGMAILVTLVTSFGSIIVASYGIGARILSFVIIPSLGLAAATTTLVGQYMGAGQVKQAAHVGRLSQRVAFFGLTIIGLLMFLLAEPLTAFFVPGEDKVIENGSNFIKIMAPSFGLLGVQQVVNGVFNGSGYTLASMLVSVFSLWVVRFPVAYVLSHNTSLSYNGLWWAFPVSNLIAAGIAFFWFRKGSWKYKKLKL